MERFEAGLLRNDKLYIYLIFLLYFVSPGRNLNRVLPVKVEKFCLDFFERKMPYGSHVFLTGDGIASTAFVSWIAINKLNQI
ncbi:hypothetical protein QE422_002109 [Chryseobacterium sp. SORGH_AS 447]|nr:hypothetical protein [Chryseobacterium sp. SORGH_AS_0447]